MELTQRTRSLVDVHELSSAVSKMVSESLEILLMGMDLKSGDEILTTTQDYPRMLTTLKQREMREGLKLNLIKIPLAPANVDDIATAFEGIGSWEMAGNAPSLMWISPLAMAF